MAAGLACGLLVLDLMFVWYLVTGTDEPVQLSRFAVVIAVLAGLHLPLLHFANSSFRALASGSLQYTNWRRRPTVVIASGDRVHRVREGANFYRVESSGSVGPTWFLFFDRRVLQAWLDRIGIELD